jgi:hypothetical protein
VAKGYIKEDHMRFTRLVVMVMLCMSLASAMWAQTSSSGDQAVAPAPQSTTVLVPPIIRFSGTLLDAEGRPMAGPLGVTFALYAQQSGGAALWMETQNVRPDENGNYMALLGDETASGVPVELFATGEARWLGIQVERQPEQPRVLLVSVPYALKAGDAQTLGGRPASDFALAGAPSVSSAPPAASSGGPSVTAAVISAAASPLTATITGTGVTNFIPLWTSASALGDSVLFQSTTKSIGIGNSAPAAKLDVTGSGIFRGFLELPATGTATSTTAFNSQPFDFLASSFSSTTHAAVNQHFRWQAEPVGNNTATPLGKLNLLFASGTGTPAETGLSINSKGQITFAPGQAFPTVAGNETVTGNVSASRLISTVANGTAPLEVTSTTQVANLNASLLGGHPASTFATLGANTFTGNQMVNGNLSAEGAVSGSSYYIGSSLFAFGAYTDADAFVGFGAGNATSPGSENTAIGTYADGAVTTGAGNTASGFQALGINQSGSYNTALGWDAGYAVNTTSYNTFVGAGATAFVGAGNSLNNATAIGANTQIELAFSNATAIGANAEVTASNALVLGSINGVNGATANTNVGIGTTAPAATLHLDLLDHGASDSLLIGNTVSKGLEFYDSGGGVDIRSFVVPLYINYAGQNTVLNATGGRVGIGTGLNIPTNLLTLVQGGGPAIADGWNTYSSRRWKTNIQPLQNALSKVEQLRGVSYDLKGSGKHEIGVIAEEVGNVVPEVVSYEKNGKDAAGVDYSRLTALLIEATKEQQDLIDKQQQQINKEQAQIASQDVQISKLRDKDVRQAHALQTVAAQMKLLQSQLAQLAGSRGELRRANQLSSPSTPAAGAQVAPAGAGLSTPSTGSALATRASLVSPPSQPGKPLK